jgi:hypothetical protein
MFEVGPGRSSPAIAVDDRPGLSEPMAVVTVEWR